jgi:hypothetical protein
MGIINPAESNAIFFNTVYPCDPSSGEMNSSKSPHAQIHDIYRPNPHLVGAGAIH